MLEGNLDSCAMRYGVLKALTFKGEFQEIKNIFLLKQNKKILKCWKVTSKVVRGMGFESLNCDG